MGSQGGNAPNPYTQRHASTLFLRVPTMDWARVKIGEKTEFRTRLREGSHLVAANTPTPVVAYTKSSLGYDSKLMVLVEHKREPLFAIADDPEAIGREGFEDYDHFRRYWRKRRKGVYRPMELVHVWRVRPWDEKWDMGRFGNYLIGHLYRDWLPRVDPLR